LTAYAIALAQLHAATTGCLEAHRHIVRAALPSAGMRPPGQGWIDREPRKVAALLGGDLPDDELMLMETRLQSPGPWLALVHGDACPDNILLAEDGEAKLIDFEFSSPGHALIDAAYWRMGFPTCWCAGRIPAAVSQRIDAAYRAALAHAVPEAADRSAFQKESAIIGAVWMFGVLAWLLEGALKEDTNWGIATKRSRILHYLDAAIEMSTAAGVLHGTCRTAGVWLDDLRDRWPLSAPLALYPAFEKPGDEG
jgi:hypothetical protein